MVGVQVHHVDQHLIFTQGKCQAIVAGEKKDISAGDLVIVPQGTKHNFINTGKEPLVLFTVYAPAEHDPNSVHKSKSLSLYGLRPHTDRCTAWCGSERGGRQA